MVGFMWTSPQVTGVHAKNWHRCRSTFHFMALIGMQLDREQHSAFWQLNSRSESRAVVVD